MTFFSFSENFYPLIGGAERSLYEIMKQYAGRFPCISHCTGDEDMNIVNDEIDIIIHKLRRFGGISSPKEIHMKELMIESTYMKNWIDISYRSIQFGFICKNELKDEWSPMVFTQGDFAYESIKSAKKSRGKSNTMLYVHDGDFACPTNFCHKNICSGRCFRCLPRVAKIQYPFIMSLMRKKRMAIRMADVVIANSEWTQKMIRKETDRDSKLLYPVLDLDKIEKPKSDDYILFLGRGNYKGFNDMYRIASTLPEYKFVVCGVTTPHEIFLMEKKNNIENWGIVDINKAFSGAKLTIMLTEAESFGRPIVESSFAGVPVIAHDVGGVKDTLGNSGMLIKRDDKRLNKFTQQIRNLMENDGIWNEYSQLALENSKRYEKDIVVEQLKNVVGFL